MPSVIWEDTVSDSGDSIMGGTRVLFVAWEITTAGPAIHPISSWDAYSLNRVGYWQLGNDLTPGGLISGIGWDVQHWMNWLVGQWVAPPGIVGADFSYAVAQYVRWSVSPGTSVHLYVFGDA